MDEETFTSDLVRFLAAEMYFLASMNASREMFGKSYFSLGAGEKQILDQAVLGAVSGNFQGLTPEFLRTPTPQQPAGFGFPQASQPKSGS